MTVALVLLPSSPSGAADGMTVLCDRADYGCVEGTGYRGQSHWGANYGRVGHNCTSYVSYRLAMAGAAQPWFTMGNANQWDERGRGKVPVDDIPAVGSVAQWEGGTRLAPGARGHVGYVEAVTDEGIEVTDDSSSGGTRRYTIVRGSPYWPDNFIHIFDTPPPAPSLEEGVFQLTLTSLLKALQNGMVTPDLRFGSAGDVPVSGNWDGWRGESVGTFRDGVWTLTDTNRTGAPTRTQVLFGTAGDLPVTGDWNGDGIDTIGVFRSGTFLLADDLESPEADHVVPFGARGDLPVTGDWDGDGIDTVGVFRDGLWILSNGDRSNPLPTMEVRFGVKGDQPVVGNWDGLRGDSIGVFRAGTWLLRHGSTSAPTTVDRVHLGAAGDLPVTGAWTGGPTMPGVAR